MSTRFWAVCSRRRVVLPAARGEVRLCARLLGQHRRNHLVPSAVHFPVRKRAGLRLHHRNKRERRIRGVVLWRHRWRQTRLSFLRPALVESARVLQRPRVTWDLELVATKVYGCGAVVSTFPPRVGVGRAASRTIHVTPNKKPFPLSRSAKGGLMRPPRLASRPLPLRLFNPL
jgi:hypothetical protein